MANLPSDEALGGMPRASSSRPIAVVDTSPLTTGVQKLGTGLASMGAGMEAYAEKQKTTSDTLDEAKATAAYTSGRAKLDDDLTSLSDVSDMKDHLPKYQQNLDAASALITDPRKRQLFALKYAPDVVKAGISVGDTIDKTEGDEETAAFHQSWNTAISNAPKVDPATRATVLKDINTQIDKLQENGRITATQAVDWKKTYAQNYSSTVLSSMPPDQRIAALTANVADNPNAKQAFSFFRSQGWTPAQAAGIVGNLLHESGGKLDPNASASGDGADGSDSIGIGQWNADRAQALKAFAAAHGKSWNDFGTQLAFVQSELAGKESKASEALSQAQTPAEATAAFLKYERPKGFEGGLTTAFGGAQRLGYAQRAISAFGGDKSVDVPGAKMAELIDPSHRVDMLSQATREWTANERADQQAQAQERATVKSLMSDDQASIVQTGKPIADLTPERVAKSLGPQAQVDFLHNRDLAQNFHDTTKDWHLIPEQEINARVESMKPQGGAPGFSQAQSYYDAAHKAADQIIGARYSDPAGSVHDVPIVKSAVPSNGPDGFLPVIKARMAAQEQIGIPEAVRSPITNDEAKRYAALLRPLSQGQASAIDQTAAIEGVVNDVQQKFGPYAKQALSRVLYQVTMKKDAADVLASAIDKMTTSQPGPLTTPDDARRVQVERDAARAAAIAGKETGDLASAALRSQGGRPTAPTPNIVQQGNMKPFHQATDLLRADPDKLMPFFIQKFGPDAVPADLVSKMPPELAAKRRVGTVNPGQ